jgi:integrase
VASITKRPNGSWRARYRDDEGHEHARHFKYRDRATRGAKGRQPGDSAQEWLDSVTTAVNTGMYVDPAAGRVTLATFYEDWAARQVWAPNTARAMRVALSCCTFRDVELAKVRRSHVETWVKTMSVGTDEQRPLAASTVRTRVANVSGMLRAAVRDRHLPANPAEGVTLPRLRRADQRMTIPEPEAVGAILRASEDWYAPFVALCAFAGLRNGEASAVRLSDVDFMRRQLHVRRQVQRIDGDLVLSAPKAGSERTVHLPDALLEILSRHVSDVGVYGTEEWLFAGDAGMPPSPDSMRYHWGRLPGTEGIKIHDLRHFFASGLIAAGCSVATVQGALGHASPSITLNTYTHLWPTAEDETRAAAAGIIAAALAAPADSSRTARA